MISDDPLAGSNTESSSEECPSKFVTGSCEGTEGEGGGQGVHHTPGHHFHHGTVITPAPGVHFRLDNSTGLLKLKSYHKSGQPSCPVCWRHRAKFYCENCICSGDFVHSSAQVYTRFTDHKLRLCSLQRDVHQTKAAISEKILESVKKRRLREEIRQIKNKIKYIKHVINTKTDRKLHTDQNLSKLVNSNSRRNDRLPEYVSKVEKIRLCVERFICDLKRKRKHCCSAVSELNKIRTSLVTSLQDIFPIEEVYPVNPDRSDIMLDFLAEAMATSYVHGRWVSVEQSGEMQYRVVSPLLACSGDYSPIYALIATSKEGTLGVEPQPALNIAAGLTVLAQYVRLISVFTGVPMPQKLNFADFGIIETSEFKFSVKVAKLNLWVVALCLALGVDSRGIRPVQTVHNVLLLVEHIKSTQLDHATSLFVSDLEESFTEFGYFEPVAPEMSVSVWEQVIHRENEELRRIENEEGKGDGVKGENWGEEEEHNRDWDTEEDNFNEWESVAAEDVLSSSPSDRTIERPTPASSLSFVSSTVSSLLWGIASPKSPRK